jgi:hypothetical protein
MTPEESDLRFWVQVAKDSERMVVCHPDLESRIKTGLDARGITGMKVVANPYCPKDSVYVVDWNALDASARQSLTRSLRPGQWRLP